ncbi:hypothetical protein PENTCL1PPCAC_23542, partial [Pristionchus entomophagus]
CKMSEECEVWECAVQWEVKVVNHIDYSLSLCTRSREILIPFHTGEMLIPFHTWSPIYEYKRMILPRYKIADKNIVVDGSIVIELKIVTGEDGKRYFIFFCMR